LLQLRPRRIVDVPDAVRPFADSVRCVPQGFLRFQATWTGPSAIEFTTKNCKNMTPMPPIVQALAQPHVNCERRPDGSLILRPVEGLQPYSRCVGEWVEHWADVTPDEIAFGERVDNEWHVLSWRQLRESVHAVAQGLLNLGIARNRPIAVLSDNSLDHALLLMGAMHVGIPTSTISTAYSRLTKDFSKLRGIIDLLQPSIAYASDADLYGDALKALGRQVRPMVSRGTLIGALQFRKLLQTRPTAEVRAALDSIRPDDHAKYLLTSGSTGQPKVVINTHRMLCANQQMIGQVWRFLEKEKPVLVDWLPWSHTFGGSHNFNMVLRNGGTLFIDDGRPNHLGIERTVQNLRSCKPNLLFNVPRGFDMMLQLLENKPIAAAEVFARIRVVFYAAAALPESTWDRIEALSARVKGERVWLTTGYGSTETSPAAATPHWPLDTSGCIGLPFPGLEMKLAPSTGKLEIRFRGPTVFPGYLHDEVKTREAFDEEGFYRMGDAGRLVDPANPERGVIFDGRLAEDFKLLSGTWVSVGTLRPRLLSVFAPYAQDLVVAGHGHDEVGLLMFPSEDARRMPVSELETHIREVLSKLHASGGGSSQVPTRVLVLQESPSIEAGEITDKGYINQRAVLDRRAGEVARLFGPPNSDGVIAASR
jgi:feruloyl-CoA synthase